MRESPPFLPAEEGANKDLSRKSGIVEVDYAGKNVWQLNAANLLALGIHRFVGAQVLPGGNLFICLPVAKCRCLNHHAVRSGRRSII